MISVVMPVYNGAATVMAAVDSVLRQSEEGFELVVVDDGSTDDTVALLESVPDRRVRVLTGPHRGIVAALNRGLTAARGDLVARMDADDVSLPLRLALQREFLDLHPEVGLVSSLVEFGGNPEEQLGYAMHVDWVNTVRSREDIRLGRFVESPFAHPSVTFRRGLVARHGGYRDGPFPEDYELWLRWLEAGVEMAKIPEVLLRWNDLPERLSRTHARYDVQAFYEVKAPYLAHWLARHNPRHPEVVVWGASRTARARAELLTPHGVRIIGYIDVDPLKTGSPVHGRPRYHCDSMPGPEEIFVVSFVGKRGARDDISRLLDERGFRRGVHYLHAA